MRTGFELKILAVNLEEAEDLAKALIARFLGIEYSEVTDKVDIELRVAFPKAEKLSEIEESTAAMIFQVTVYGSVKQNSARPFGQ
jgi:hypothetical protein